MKLLFAHDHVFYHFNNQYFSTGGLSKEMLERYTSVFDEVVVVSRQKKMSCYDERLTSSSLEKVRFVKIPDFKSLSTCLRIFEAKRIINKEIENCDVVIARLPSSIGTIAAKLALKYKKPYLLEIVACPWDSLWNHSVLGKILAPFSYFTMKGMVKKAKYSVYVTKEFLQMRYPTLGKSVNCSNVALKDFGDLVLNNRLNKISSMSTDQNIVIGTIAAVNVKHKGQQYIIRALGELKKVGVTNFQYQLVGGGDKCHLERICKKYDVVEEVVFLGNMPHEEVFNWLDSIDIYSQPSRQEGLPRALIEAMSRGLPAFGAKTAGIPELIEAEFIFSNTRNNIKEITSILKVFTKENMINQAKRNMDEARKYEKKVIEERRYNFFKEFQLGSIFRGDFNDD